MPRQYVFLYVLPDGTPNYCWVIARNSDNAVRWFHEQMNRQELRQQLPVCYVYSPNSYVGILLAMLLPWYTYTGEPSWSDWQWLTKAGLGIANE